MKTEVTLKKPTLDDLEFIQWLWSDLDTMDPVGGPILLNDYEARNWFSKMISPGSPTDSYRLIYNQDNVPVGEISFHRLDPDTMTADFNIKIASKYRKRGYAKKAMDLFLDHYFNQFGGQEIQDKVAANNSLGKKYLLGYGFMEVPVDKDYHLLKLSKERFIKLQEAQK
jgi:RimJ/RimL family protein N-acetyltransferase